MKADSTPVYDKNIHFSVSVRSGSVYVILAVETMEVYPYCAWLRKGISIYTKCGDASSDAALCAYSGDQ
eukprot:6997-Pyramimonas_sp.AAC.3